MDRKFADKRRETVSRFGTYQGYREKMYDGTRRFSDYLALSDGTRLAYDLILPTKRGVPTGTALPVLFKYTPYMRTWTMYDKNGKSNIAELEALPWYQEAFLRLRSWLVPNGIMKEAPIHFYLMGVPKQEAWKSTEVWPLKSGEMTRYYFEAGETGDTASINAGSLVLALPTASEASDSYMVDYTTTTGTKARWTAINWVHHYPNMRSNDAKALTYTTPPFETPLQIIGHPVAHVWLSCDAPDVDLFAYLEEVDGSGHSTYVTEGNLRASHRTLGQAPYENLGLPYHTHFQSELKSIPAGEPVELVFDLLPTAYQIARGSRVRITIACADADNFETPILNPAPTLHVLRNASHPSSLELPVAQLIVAR